MRLPFRRRVVLENLARPRLGLSERQEREVRADTKRRLRTGQVTVLGAVGLPASFKFDGQEERPGRLHPQGHSGGASREQQ